MSSKIKNNTSITKGKAKKNHVSKTEINKKHEEAFSTILEHYNNGKIKCVKDVEEIANLCEIEFNLAYKIVLNIIANNNQSNNHVAPGCFCCKYMLTPICDNCAVLHPSDDRFKLDTGIARLFSDLILDDNSHINDKVYML